MSWLDLAAVTVAVTVVCGALVGIVWMLTTGLRYVADTFADLERAQAELRRRDREDAEQGDMAARLEAVEKLAKEANDKARDVSNRVQLGKGRR